MRNKLLMLFALLGLLACVPNFAQANAKDEKVMKSFEKELRALQQAFFASDDLEKRIEVQKQMQQLFTTTLTQLSDETRPVMEVSVKVVLPLQQQAAEFMDLAAKFSSSGQGDPATIKERGDIAPRIATLEELERRNAALLAEISTMNERLSRALDAGKVTGKQRAGFLAGFNETTGRSLGPMKAIRTLDGQIFAEMKRLYRLLDEQWGKWKYEDEDFVWQDSEAEKACLEIRTSLGTLLERESAAEAELSKRTQVP